MNMIAIEDSLLERFHHLANEMQRNARLQGWNIHKI